MNTTHRRFRFAVFGLALLAVASATLAETPPSGRWRCYQPPAYKVLAWFDLADGRIAVDGNVSQTLGVDPATGRLGLPAGVLTPYRYASYLLPGSTHGDAERHTLVLLRTAREKPGGRTWEDLPRCYMTTH